MITVVDMARMDEKTRLTFGINVYNLMVTYAFIKVGIGTTSLTRSAFFGKTKFNIGGLLFSLNDLEHGVLRANARHPYAISPTFGKGDPRAKLALPTLDCRLHFGLHCGAKSCPPIKYFRRESIEEELRVVALSFCGEDETVSVDEDSHSLTVSMIFKWYERDFCESKERLPEAIVKFLKGPKKEALERMIAKSSSNDGTKKQQPIAIAYHTYDWTANASHFKPYSASDLKANELNPSALLQFEGLWNCGGGDATTAPANATTTTVNG